MSLGIIHRERAVYGRARADEKGGEEKKNGGREQKGGIHSDLCQAS